MFSQPMSTSLPTNELSYPAISDNKDAIAGGNLMKGLNRLTRILERKVDRQIMTAQIRAYDCPSESFEKPRYM